MSSETWIEIGVPGGIKDALLQHLKLADAVVVDDDGEDYQEVKQVKMELVKAENDEVDTSRLEIDNTQKRSTLTRKKSTRQPSKQAFVC